MRRHHFRKSSGLPAVLLLTAILFTAALPIRTCAQTSGPISTPVPTGTKQSVTTASAAAPSQQPSQLQAPAAIVGTSAPQDASFWHSFSPPLWVVLITSIAGVVATLWVAPRTALKVAEKQAEGAREAVAASLKSAEAARDSAAAATLNAQVAAQSATNQGIHAVARLRQEWINELRARVAQANALLSNWTPDRPQNQIELNEAVTKIELLLNPKETASQELLAAIKASEEGDHSLKARQANARNVITCAQAILKDEWDRVRRELKGEGAV